MRFGNILATSTRLLATLAACEGRALGEIAQEAAEARGADEGGGGH